MDEEQKNPGENPEVKVEETQEAQTPASQSVSFSPISVKSPRKPSSKAILIVIAVIIFIVIGFFIFKGASGPKENPTPSPLIKGVTISTSTPTPVVSASPIVKSKVVFEIQNGTGITGEAAYIRDILKNLGYSNFKLGNATSADNATTTVTYAKTLSQTAQDEITAKLKEVYKEVEVKTTSSTSYDVLIVTGLKKGATAKPSASPTSSASPVASKSPSPTPTPTPTATGQ
jgi:hypothetical protein